MKVSEVPGSIVRACINKSAVHASPSRNGLILAVAVPAPVAVLAIADVIDVILPMSEIPAVHTISPIQEVPRSISVVVALVKDAAIPAAGGREPFGRQVDGAVDGDGVLLTVAVTRDAMHPFDFSLREPQELLSGATLPLGSDSAKTQCGYQPARLLVFTG